MPAQKRESDPHEPQPKLRKLDEDGEALPSKIGPATNSLITGQIKEKTEAAPRTKKKRSSSGEGESLPAKSSKQDSLPEECGKTTSDPPLLKAKLLKATSASCGEAPSQRANSNASLKRSASTESDDDLSSDGSKADFFRERDDEDKARCIRKYSSKAEESSDLHEGLPSSPADPVQMDHNYGRFSDATSLESTEDSNEKISSAESFYEQGKQETPHDAKEKVSTGTSEPETRSIEASVKIDSAAEESKHNEFKDLESHILLGYKASACSGEVLDSVTAVGDENEKTDQTESIRSQKDVDNETIAQSEETLCSTVVEVTSSGRGDEAADDETDLTFRSESQTHLSDQSVSEEVDQSIRCKLKDGGVAGQLDEVLLNKTTSSPEQVEENATTSKHVAIPETQTELKVQVSAEELNAADAIGRLCDDVNNALEKSEETLEENVQEPADVPHPASCPGPLVEGEPNNFCVISDSCTDTSPECKSVHEEIQIEMLAENNLVSEGQMTPEVDLQSQEKHLVYDSIAKAAAEVKEDVVISHCSASPDTQIQEDCNPDVTVETQSQEVYESATTVSTYVYEDDVERLRENKECESLESLTVEASEISGPVPPSAEIHDDGVTADECENSLEHAGPAEGQSAMETQTVDVEIQEGPVSEPITDEDQKDPENTNSTSSEAADCVKASAESLIGVELQTTTVSEETRNEEMHIWMNQEVSEHTSDIDIEAQRGVQNENCAAQVQISHDVEAVVSSEEASNVMEEAEDTQMVSKPTADVLNKSQTVWEDKAFKNCEESKSVSSAVQSQTEVGEEAKATSEEASDVASIEEMQTQMVSEPITHMPEETHRDLEKANCVAQIQIEDGVEAVVSSEEASDVMEEAEETQMVGKPITDVSNETQTVWEDAAAAQSQTEVGNEAQITSEVSNIAPITVIQSHMVSDAHIELEKANCVAQIQIEEGVEAVVSSEEASDAMEEAEETLVSKPTTDVWEDAAAAQSQTEVGDEAKITSEEASDVVLIEEMQTQMVSERLTGIPEETHKEPESSTLKTGDEMSVSAAAQSQIEEGVEAEVSSEEASDVMEEAEETQMVRKPITDVSNKTLTVWDAAVAAAVQSQTEVDQEAKATSEVSNIAPIKVIQSHMVSDAHRELENANCVALIQIEDHVETKITSEEASNISSIEEMQIQLVSEPVTGISEETYKELESSTLKTSDEMFVSAAAQSQTEDQEESMSTSNELPKIAAVDQVQTQRVSEPTTHMLNETYRELDNANCVAQIQIEDGVEAEVSSEEASDVMEEAEETQMVRKPTTGVSNESVWEDAAAAAQSLTEVGEEAKITSEEASDVALIDEMQTQMVSERAPGISEEIHEELESSTLKTSDEMFVFAAAQSQTEDQEEAKSTSDELPKIAPLDQVQTQMISEPTTHMPEETHRELDKANCVAQIQKEEDVEAEVSSEEASDVMEEAEETQMVSKPTTDVWEDAAAAQSQTEVGEEAKITLEEASDVALIEEMQTQMVSERLTGIPEETHKEPESSTLKTGDEMFVSAAAQSQIEDQEEAKSTSDELPKIAPVDQVQTQMISEPVTHMSVGLLENNEENVETAENNKVGFEHVAVTPCQMEVEDQSYPTSSVGVNKIQTEVNTQMGEKSSNTDFVIGLQTQTNLDFGGQTKDDTSEDVHEDLMVGNPQNMENDNEINSENVTEQENQTQQITAESEIAEAAPLVEMQSEKNQNETSEQVSAEESQNQKSQRVGEQITDVEFVNVSECQNKTETSQLSAETLIQKSLNITEPDVSQQQSLRGSSDEDKNRVTENQVDVAESPNETQEQAAEMFEDISQPTTPEQTQSLVDQEVSELIRDTQGLAETQIQRSLGPNETVKDLPEQVEEKSRIPSMDIAEMTNKTEVAEALEEIPLPPATELTQVHRGQEVMKSVGASENHPITDMQTSAEFDQKQRCEEEAESVDEAASGCENVPEVLMETSASEHQNHLAEEPVEHAASDMKTTLLVNVDTKDKDVQVEAVDVISGPLGSDENNKVKVDEPVSNMEGGAESSDVIVFVCDQSDVQAPEEQIKPVNREFHDDQVVYEPISSPESNSGGGVCTTMELGETISFLDLQNTETHHTVSGESRILTSDDTVEAAHSNQEEEIVTAEICVPDSQAAAEMEVDTISEAQLEQSNTTEAFEQVAAVSSSDDIGVAEDATEKRETPAEVTETVQEEDAAAPTSDEAEVPDGSSEEYVILEPVPEDNIHFDIVTQAVAESGLSASLCPGDVSGDEIANQNVLKDPQQAEIKEDVTADGGECLVFTSSGDVLDQEMETNIPQDVPNSYHLPSSTTEGTDITNSHSQHTVEDAGLMVVENEKCHLDLQQVQILEDIEIGHEIVVAEEENEENCSVTAVKPPDQPTEVSSEKSDQKVNDEANETTKQSKTEDEEKVFEVPKPKKQEMNTQARTKARMAALAREKAAASKRSANRQQLNLLALCQEIAEDIATDSNLLKKIEEEKQAVAAAEAAKAEARQKELPPAVSEEADPASVATPAEPEETSGSVTPAPEPSPAQPSTAADDSADTKPATDPPKRRFFISQISVPLKAHEKKKLTRYQRLRQVELQREKMSWARVKKLKSDQANQMFSDVDWQASFSGGFLMSPPTPPPAPSPPKTSPTSPAETSQPAQPKAEAPTAETPTAEPPTAEPAQSGPPIPETSKTEPPKPESSETEPVKPEKSKTEPPPRENRRSTRQSKALASQAAAAPAPAPKVTRSASKKTLPATPPPMPNGLNAQKQKPVEYKPYRPRPKYSPDDFELDDDDLLLASPARPRPQQSPASPQPTNQTRLKPHTAPPGQISGQSKPTAAAQAQLKPTQSKPSVTATPPLKPAPSASAPLKSPEPVSPSGRPKPAASAPPQLKTSVGAKSSDSVASETKPAAAAQKTENLSSQEKQKSQKTADPLPSVECSKVSNEKCEEKPAVTTSSSAPENNSEPAETEDQPSEKPQHDGDTKPQDSATHLSEASLQKEVKKLKEADKDSSQTIIDAGQKHFGPVACSMCGMLYSAANPEDESQHLLFHNQFISAVKYVGWKKERILAEFPDGKIILVLPDDPKYALKKVEEIREMVDNDLGFQQVETKCPSQTKTFLFISIDKKVAGCLIAENIQEGYRVIEEPVPEGSEGEKVMFERQRAWCCSTTPEPAICGISRIWVVSMMRRRGIATRMIECLRNNFIYGSYLSKDEIAFSDPTPDGKLFAMHYFGTSQFLVYNFVSGPRSIQPKTHAV